jgi:nitrogen fixation/metabolism regulation signal transduction histidine kinase
MKTSYKRRVYVVNKSLQYRFVAWVVGTVFAAVAVVLADVAISLHRHAIETGLSVQVRDLYNPTELLTLAKLVIYALGVYFASLLLSHRLAGPIYRLEKSADQVAQGDLTHKVFLRERDELARFRDSFNTMVDTLRGKVAGDVACAFRAKKQLEALLKPEEDGSPLPEAAADRVKRAISEMERVGKEFKI